MSEAAERMDPKVLAYLNEGQIETFESFETFSIIAFDWYDVHSARTADSQMLLYLDRKDLLLFCEDDAAEEKARSIVAELTKEGPMDNEQLLYRFFVRLLKGDMAHLDQLEADISDGESAVLSGTAPGIWTVSPPGAGSCCGSSGITSSWTPFSTSFPPTTISFWERPVSGGW